jgi:hypothetical protein
MGPLCKICIRIRHAGIYGGKNVHMTKKNRNRITDSVRSPKPIPPNKLIQKNSASQYVDKIYKCLRAYCPEFMALTMISM